jgi:hypothetical protein
VAQIEGRRHELPDIQMNDPARATIGDLFTRLTQSLNNALDHQTVGQLVRELYGQRAPSRQHDERAEDALPEA